MTRSVIVEDSLLENTGKPLPEWIAIVKQQKLPKHGQIVKFLKSEHGMTHGFANFVALKTLKTDAASHDADDLVDAQYAKGKEQLKPIYEQLLAEIGRFGDDIDVVPKKANVSLRRKTQFALIQPSTKTRIDLGLKIKDKETTDRLESSGPFGSMCTHRVRLTDASQVDDQLIGWLREAYDAAA
jgi:predicted transport protein